MIPSKPENDPLALAQVRAESLRSEISSMLGDIPQEAAGEVSAYLDHAIGKNKKKLKEESERFVKAVSNAEGASS